MAKEPKLTLVEEAPPPRTRGAKKLKYKEHIDNLRDKPGTWFKIMEDDPKVIQSATAYCRKHFAEEGFEFSMRSADGVSSLYAIFNNQEKTKAPSKKEEKGEESSSKSKSPRARTSKT